ncbi:MAG TPA: hypothetical protein VMY38_06575 [Gemmatimonadaceae bacterium]|nr:hypothetical protein [Gemmatimonadaceae bacterium]
MDEPNRIRFSILPLALCALVTVAGAQGRGQGQGKDKPRESDARVEPRADRGRDDVRASQGRDNADKAARDADRARSKARIDGDNGRANRGNSADAPNPSARAFERASSNARFKRNWTSSDIRPDLRGRIASNRHAERIAAGALAHGFARNVGNNAFVITPSGRQMLVRNRAGDVLVALDDDRARNLGGWRVKPVEDRVEGGAPSFCRSGAGHPNWGRQWCIDKGFGLGAENDLRWGRNLDLNDVVFLSEPASTTLTRAALAALLGDRAVDRLALHAITLGLTDPLVGTWRADPAGPRVLLVNSGAFPVAEIVDVNRDRRSDRMVVALRPW